MKQSMLNAVAETAVAAAGAPVLICREGALIPYATLHAHHQKMWRELAGAPVREAYGLLVPQCRSNDTLVGQPPLAFRPTLDELVAIATAGEIGVCAATCFGPDQDKRHNEDFALAAAVDGPYGELWLVACVADGVSTRTFWPERAARIACFVALRVLSRHVMAGRALTDVDVQQLRRGLTESLLIELQADQRLLMRHKAVPADWRPETFARNQRKTSYWYNSTLLVALAGPAGVLLLWCGDGGITVEKVAAGAETTRSRPLESTASLEVTDVVSLTGAAQFAAGHVSSVDLSEIRVLLATDGVDRTRQRTRADLEMTTATDAEQLAAEIERLFARKGAEMDNHSAALLRWRRGVRASSAARRAGANLAQLLSS